MFNRELGIFGTNFDDVENDDALGMDSTVDETPMSKRLVVPVKSDLHALNVSLEHVQLLKGVSLDKVPILRGELLKRWYGSFNPLSLSGF